MKIVAMMLVHNNEDVIKEVIDHLLSQGLELVVLDNGSTDDTFEICKKYAGKNLIKLKQFKTKSFHKEKEIIIRALYDIALLNSPDWVILSDSDEILESGIPNKNLKEAIEQVDSEGYNLIQFDRFDFFMTNDDDETSKSVKKKFTYYSAFGDFVYRSWKFYPGIMMHAGGHYPYFPNEIKYKIYPRKFVLRHYPFRSKEQVEKKIRGKTRGVDYKKTTEGLTYYTLKLLEMDPTKKIDYKLLTKYNEDGKWNYEIKYFPYDYHGTSPSKKEDIFTKDGYLKIKYISAREYHLKINYLRRNTYELRFRSWVYRTKKDIRKKFPL